MHVGYVICLSTAHMSKWGVKCVVWGPFNFFFRPTKICKTSYEYDWKTTVYEQKHPIQ